MNPIQGVSASHVTATGLQTITSANAALVGVLFQSSGTAFMQIFHGVTASAAATLTVRAYVTVTGATANAAVYLPLNGMASGGITMNMGASTDPKLTLYWLPIP